MEPRKLNDYEKMFLTGLKQLGRKSKLQLMKLGVPSMLITKLVKGGIITQEKDGECMYYKVADDIG